MTSEKHAPAAMPSEEEIKDLLLRFHADTAAAYRHERDGIATFAARTILTLFAPVLAEKERLADAKARALEYADTQFHRALAAEAALAAERERCAKIAEAWRGAAVMTPAGAMFGANTPNAIAAAIRAQGE